MTSYEYYKSIGLCPHCRQMKPAEGKVYCPNCLDEQALMQMELRATLSAEQRADIRKRQTEYDRERYARLKAEGICPKCGKRKARHGRVMCAYCSGKDNERHNVKYHQKEGRNEADN